MSPARVAAIVPARMASSRFPGKPLVAFHGLPMVEHVRRRAVLSGTFSDVVVATCDDEIARVVGSYGGRVIMTSDEHPSATDRVAEAGEHLDCTHVVNLQGDELLVLPEDLARMAGAISAAPGTAAWNAVGRVDSADELSDPSFVKCVLSRSGRILHCTRDLSALPVKPPYEPVRKILGVLGFERSFLAGYRDLPRGPLELAESIDQCRPIENDVPLHAVEFRGGYIGINYPREAADAERYLVDDPLQREALDALLKL